MARWLGAVIAVILMAPATARADRDWHAGVNVRSELGTHPLRVDGGARLGDWDFVLVLDPMFWTDGEHDIDALATWRFAEPGWALLGGWRAASIALAEGRRFHESLLVGIVAPLPDVGRLRVQWGVEAALLVVSHGAGLPSDTVSLGGARELGDHLNVSMFLRLEYASPF